MSDEKLTMRFRNLPPGARFYFANNTAAGHFYKTTHGSFARTIGEGTNLNCDEKILLELVIADPTPEEAAAHAALMAESTTDKSETV